MWYSRPEEIIPPLPGPPARQHAECPDLDGTVSCRPQADVRADRLRARGPTESPARSVIKRLMAVIVTWQCLQRTAAPPGAAAAGRLPIILQLPGRASQTADRAQGRSP